VCRSYNLSVSEPSTVPGRKVKEEGAMVVIEHYDLGSLAVGKLRYEVVTWVDRALVLSIHDSDAEAVKARLEYEAQGISAVITEIYGRGQV
jgi:hypothetical protein